MTLDPNTTHSWTYTGDGTTAAYAYEGLIFGADDLQVSIDGADQTLAIDYTVSGVGGGTGGNVTFTAAPAVGATVVVLRRPIPQQLYDVQPGPLDSEALERELDRQTLVQQGLIDRLGNQLELDLSGPAWDAQGYRIAAAGDPVADSDVATRGSIQGQVDAAAASETQAALARDAAQTAQTGAETAQAAAGTAATDARLWASEAEDVQVDDGTHQGYSAYHWQAKAAASAAGLNLPAIDAADAGRLLRINGVGDGYETYATVPTIGAGDSPKGLRVKADGSGYDLAPMRYLKAGYASSTTGYTHSSTAFTQSSDSLLFDPERDDTEIVVTATFELNIYATLGVMKDVDVILHAYDRPAAMYEAISLNLTVRERHDNSHTSHYAVTLQGVIPAAWHIGQTAHARVYTRLIGGIDITGRDADAVFLETLP